MMRGVPWLFIALALVMGPFAAAHGGLDDGHRGRQAALPVPFVESGRLLRDGEVLEVGGVRLVLGTNGTHVHLAVSAAGGSWIVLGMGPGHVQFVEGPGGEVLETHYATLAVSAFGNATTGDLVASQPATLRGHALLVDADLDVRLVPTPDPRVALRPFATPNVTSLRAEFPLSWLGVGARSVVSVGLFVGNESAEPPEEVSKALHQRLLLRAVLLGPDDDAERVGGMLRRDHVPWFSVAFLVALPGGAWVLAARRR